MNKEYKIKLDLNKKLYNKKMAFNQFDENVNDFYIEITKNNEVVKDLDKSIITLVAIKPNSEVDAQFIEVKEGQIYVDLKPSMCDLVGNYQAKAMITLEGKIITTDTITYSVNEDKIISKLNDDVISDERFTLFTDALVRLSDIEASEEQRIVNEAERILSEENRKIEEAKRVEAELIMQHEEADRAKYDAIRESNENIRKQNESIRLSNEANRIDEEAKRVEEENERKLAEEERNTNELDRQTQEDRRVSNEVERISNENTRKVSENARAEAEKQRVDAENLRKEKIIEIQTDYDSLKKVIIDENASANLQNQINQTNSQLDNFKNLSSLIIDLKLLGVMEGSSNEIIENNTAILQNLIEQYSKGQVTFYLPKGTYYFNPIDLTNISGSIVIRLKGENNGMSTSWFKGISTTIKTNMQDFIYDKRSNSPGITFYVDDIKIYSYDGYNQVPTGVCFGAETDKGNEYNFHFYNVLIHGFDYGFKSPGFSCAGSGGKNFTLSTCHYGIYIKKASHLFQADNVELLYNRVGIRFGHGGSPCSISNIHVATGYLGADKDEFDRFIAIHTKGDVHISNIYQEAYDNSAQAEKTTIIDYEGWAYGLGPIIVENTPIAKPSGKGGLFFKGRTFLGAGTEEGVSNPTTIYSGNLGHYPNGCAKFVNCRIGNNIDIASIFDVPTQSPGYDIDNKLFYYNSKIINKNNIGRVNSKWNYTSYNITSVTEGDNIYNIYNNANFDEVCEGFKVSELIAHKEFDSTANIKLKGNIIIEDALSDALDVAIGFMHKYFINNVVNYKFYPVTTLKGLQGVSSFSFDFNIDRIPGEDYRTSINICTMFKDNANKLKVADFSKIRFKYEIETYRY